MMDSTLISGYPTIRDQMCDAAISLGVPIVDLFYMFRQSDGTALPGTTWDGIHFTAQAYAKIKSALDPVVSTLFQT